MSVGRATLDRVDRLSNQQIADAGLADWRKLAQAVHARFRGATRASFTAAVLALDPAPDVRLTGDVVDVAVATREDGIWVTERDLDTARAISALAREHGLVAEPGEVTQIELALDTAREDAVGPFWSALLTGSADNKI